MKGKKLQDAMGLIDEDLCEDAENTQKNKKAAVRFYISRLAPIAAVLVVLIAVGAILTPFGNKSNIPTSGNTATTAAPYDFTIPAPSIPSNLNRPPVSNIESDPTLPFCVAQARYPAMAQYPEVEKVSFEIDSDGFTHIPLHDEYDEEAYKAWREGRNKQRSYLNGNAPLDSFFLRSMQEFLKTENDENIVYSPVNVFMALSMCAEISDGNTRKQILTLLGAENIDDLRSYAYAVWNGSYCDDGTVKSILANSMWLNEDVNFNKDVLHTLSNSYFASTFSGKAGSEEFTQALREWINQQTGNLLQDEVNSIEITPKTIMSLVSTVYFKAKWEGGFSEKNTKEDIFYAKDGELPCDFMNTTLENDKYYWGEKFSATSLNLSESGTMWFVLPDEGVEINDLIKDPELQDFLISQKYTWENQTTLKINLSLPKFDTKSTINLKEGLGNLGVTDCFDKILADFSNLTTDEKDRPYINSASHSTRVMVDEEGVIATAFTEMLYYNATCPPPNEEEIDFILNRPFLFFIENENGIMLFSGVVNNP